MDALLTGQRLLLASRQPALAFMVDGSANDESSTRPACGTWPPPGACKKERKKTDNPRERLEDGTPPPHRDFKEMGVMR